MRALDLIDLIGFFLARTRVYGLHLIRLIELSDGTFKQTSVCTPLVSIVFMMPLLSTKKMDGVKN